MELMDMKMRYAEPPAPKLPTPPRALTETARAMGLTREGQPRKDQSRSRTLR